MNITPTTVKAYHITLPEPELRALIAELPVQSPFAGPMKAALNGAFDEDAPRKKAPKGPRIQLEKVACPHCGKRTTPGRMVKHIASKHPGQS